MELGEGGKSAEPEQATHEAKAPASEKQPTSSDPEPGKESKATQETSSPPPAAAAEKKPEPPKQQAAPQAPKESPPPPSPPRSDSQKPQSKSSAAESPFGNREERRVCVMRAGGFFGARHDVCSIRVTGQNEPYALADRRKTQTIPKYSGVTDDIQRSRHVFADGIPEALQGRDSEEDRGEVGLHERFLTRLRAGHEGDSGGQRVD